MCRGGEVRGCRGGVCRGGEVRGCRGGQGDGRGTLHSLDMEQVTFICKRAHHTLLFNASNKPVCVSMYSFTGCTSDVCINTIIIITMFISVSGCTCIHICTDKCHVQVYMYLPEPNLRVSP